MYGGTDSDIILFRIDGYHQDGNEDTCFIKQNTILRDSETKKKSLGYILLVGIESGLSIPSIPSLDGTSVTTSSVPTSCRGSVSVPNKA